VPNLPQPRSRRRRIRFLLICLAATLASVAAMTTAVPTALAGTHAKHGHRVGGAVGSAWPATGHKPRAPLARWLGRQVGAIAPQPCAAHWRQAQRRCHLGTGAASVAAVAGDPGSPPGARARIGAAKPVAPLAADAATASVSANEIALPLKLVRSYEIPVGDPSYTRLLNWSWIYDSAVSAAAFAATGDKANSAQLLDQLAALQHTDGSIELAFNVVTGESAPVFRSGTVAWLGLAAATYDQAFNSNRYLETEQRAAEYLLSLEGPTGLVRGGPDVQWYSTEHNLTAYVFLTRLGAELQAAGSTAAANRYEAAATALSAAINTNLLVVEPTAAHFRQGLGDDTQAIDAQALGAMYLQGTGQPVLAAEVIAYARANFGVVARSVKESSDPATYNMTYSAAGPFSGYAPYAGKGAPDVLWAEGSGEMRVAEGAVGTDAGALEKSIAAWTAITSGTNQGPLQADKTVTSQAFGLEYHVWPAASAAAWTMLAPVAPAFFAAPLPAATTLVSGWTKVRGGNQITTYPEGRVEMLTSSGGGERRVLAGPATATDYTVTSNATLRSGAGYGVYVRATVDSGTKLTGYCVQVDHGYGTGQIVVREILGDAELTVPLAHVAVPTGFAWYGTPHILAVAMKGNTMSVSLDGAKTLAIPDLAAASAVSVKYSYGAASTLTAPTAGGYGMRSWGDGVVSLQQMTVGP
jgi:hypothetical protein